MSGQEWRGSALCAQVDPELFYPEKGGSATDAKRLCGLCPVTEECLRDALDNNEEHGVWGGLTRTERERLRSTEGAVVASASRVLRDRHDPAVIAAAVNAILAGQADGLLTLSVTEKDETVARLVQRVGHDNAARLLRVGVDAIGRRLTHHRTAASAPGVAA